MGSDLGSNLFASSLKIVSKIDIIQVDEDRIFMAAILYPRLPVQSVNQISA